jgi:hypothetical protein
MLAVIGIAATVVGVAALTHPFGFWPYGAAHKSNGPPVWGVGFLVVPVVIAAIGLRRLWNDLTLDVELRRQRARHKRG